MCAITALVISCCNSHQLLVFLKGLNNTTTLLRLILTISILAISEGRGHCDNASLPNTHSQKALIHPSNQPPNPNIGVVGTHTGVAAVRGGKRDIFKRKCIFVVTACVQIPFYTEPTWNQRASRPGGCRYSGSGRSQTPPPFWCRWLECGRCRSGRRLPGSTHRAAGRQSGGWHQEG